MADLECKELRFTPSSCGPVLFLLVFVLLCIIIAVSLAQLYALPPGY